MGRDWNGGEVLRVELPFCAESSRCPVFKQCRGKGGTSEQYKRALREEEDRETVLDGFDDSLDDGFEEEVDNDEDGDEHMSNERTLLRICDK